MVEDEEVYDLYPGSITLPYPSAGNGVSLPREKDDLAFLIDDDAVTFSHAWGWDPRELFGGNEPDTGIVGLGRAIGVGA